MSSSGSGEQRAAPAEQHLGDRLAAFVDGELADDTRDRVLAHLVTCPQCKAAAAEQRRLKSVVAGSEPPALSAGLLARLQGLPGGGDGPLDGRGGGRDDHDDHDDRGPFDGSLLGSGVFRSALNRGADGAGRVEEFSFLTPSRDLVAPAGSRARGFRIHEMTRAAQPPHADSAHGHPALPAHGGPAAASRGRRFAFAAAGAFSMAAIALGGALPMEAAVDGGARPDDGPAVSPLTANSVSDTRGDTPRGVLDAGDRRQLRAPARISAVTPVSVSRPLLAPGDLPLVTPAATPVSPTQAAASVHH
ncbi:zf-HC2 domain-containing protein [Streptomyces sp. NPDC051976]|uniref:zf-HC2 domain-containing protein n=1 Tax=Streptomyces sp. NPDC051976 TaxID=3154947 RepID=UPI0034193ABE